MKNYLTGIDFVLIVIYIALILSIGHTFSRKLPYKALRKYFVAGLTLKLLCGLGFGWIYVYYYGGGDTQNYFRGGSIIYTAVFSGHGLGSIFDKSILPLASDSTYFIQQITGIVNLFSFNSFWTCTLLFASLSFLGQWLLFISFFKIFPQLHKHLAVVALFIPGVAFWSSGIMKDSLCMLSIGIIVYGVQNIFLYNKQKLISLLLIVGAFYMTINLKAYIALALLVALALYALLTFKSKIKNRGMRILLLPIASIVIFGAALLAINQIGDSLQRYSLENITETAQVYQGYHARTSVAGRGSEVRTGSGYTLGEINFSSPASILSKIPAALNVTFFRPYVWEVSNPVMLLSALESLIILIFTIKVIRRTGIGRFFKIIATYKEVLFCISFALIFGFAVGFTTYNFGSLVRYKAPCIPFLLIGLVLINDLRVREKGNGKLAIRRPLRHQAMRRLPS